MRSGVAMSTAASEALAVHRKAIGEMRNQPLKGGEAVCSLHGVLNAANGCETAPV